MVQIYRWSIRIATVVYCFYMLFVARNYHFMALNVLLGYIPLELSFHYKKVNNQLFLLLGILWLLFYPNAPYLFTDFFHLENLSIYQGMNQIFGQSLSAWFSFSLLTVGICVYGLLGMATVFTTLNECFQRNILNKKWQGFLFIMIVNVLSSLAIFVGRFDRLHSVHLLTKPIQTLQIIFFNWSVNKVLFILLFTGMQFLLLAAIFGLKGLRLVDEGEM
ncbi:hypothetical protein UAW_00929 [Enterococcus haemoperoxidus ATCC BAA-382]|uniref:DUF1361 domain-containing protein n=2 Tax=Enterococcus haemoperoxidus TaxID=155618 RepID=R2T447_9ENTE|nr:hypothetical protein UAW_00929 [Enterococcus haemoperoxidus ATCC BAA-382]EOT62482.1 hypothetical protein I583_01482 [Enterococcus haemoperoxidus ATCC BAA-382]